MASHQFSDDRAKLMLLALESLKEQSLKPSRVIISFSCESNMNPVHLEQQWMEMLGDIPSTIYFHDERLLQFEHFKFIRDKAYNLIKDSTIGFLDDDDMYSVDRIRNVESFLNGQNGKPFPDYNCDIVCTQWMKFFDTKPLHFNIHNPR
jgi:hypothetical protein